MTHFFAHHGFADVYTYPFTLADRFERMSTREPAVIQNTQENRTHLRAHLCENLLDLVADHYRTTSSGGFFEVGNIFDGNESLQAVGVMW